MTDAKPQLAPEVALRRAATSLPLDATIDGMKACAMLGLLAQACVKARDDAQVLTPEGLLRWLDDNGFKVEG